MIVLWDDNNISIDGTLDMACSDDQLKRFEASGWDAVRVDGHDPDAIANAIDAAQKSNRPSLIACKTIIGYGSPNKQGTAATHGAALGEEEVAATRKELGWDSPPFEIPDHILSAWRAVGRRGSEAHSAWRERAAKLSEAERAQLGDPVTPQVMADIKSAVKALKAKISAEAPSVATRVSNKMVLEELVPVVPGIIGGSADLTGSNGCITSKSTPIKADDFSANYMHYGVREHAMAAAMNGMALHGGIVPYAGTFLMFADYSRGAIRLGALMGVRVIHVMTHDSIGLGEDGPTHQPVATLAALRAIPNINVFRPADTVEAAECWEIALSTPTTPSVMSMTRQNLPTVRLEHTDENLSAKGAYILRDTDGDRDVTLLATGSEVEIALAAADILKDNGVKAAVVSMPCWEVFAEQDHKYRHQVLGDAPRVGVEAAVRFGWDRWLGDHGGFVGMKGFGASAPIDALYKHFGITAKDVAEKAREKIASAQS